MSCRYQVYLGWEAPRMGILFTCCPGPGQRLELWGSVGPQTSQVTLEGLNGSKMKGRWLEEDYNMGKCWVKNWAFWWFEAPQSTHSPFSHALEQSFSGTNCLVLFAYSSNTFEFIYLIWNKVRIRTNKSIMSITQTHAVMETFGFNSDYKNTICSTNIVQIH